MGRLARPAIPPSSGAVLFYIPLLKENDNASESEYTYDNVAMPKPGNRWDNDSDSAQAVTPLASPMPTTTHRLSTSSNTLVGSIKSFQSSEVSSRSSSSEQRQTGEGSGIVLSNANALVALVKDVCEAFDGVPYIKIVASAVHLILEVTEAVQHNQQRASELVDKVKIYSKDVFEALLILKFDENDVLDKLKEDLLDIAKVLTNIHEIIQTISKSNRVKRILQRNEILARIEEYDRRLDTCITSFQVRSLAALRAARQASTTQVIESPPGYSGNFRSKLRSKPQIIYGREKEIEEIINLVTTAQTSARIAILGSGGIGKTSLALSVLHDDRICTRYGDQRLFISCEAVTCTEQLITELAFILQVQKDGIAGGLITSIFRRLEEKPTMVVLDNFETPWDRAESRTSIESFLQDITSIETCTVIVTMRGSQRPGGVQWTTSLPPLPPIDLESATMTFRTISNKSDEFAVKLIKAVDCVPLAVTLLANLAAVDGETTEALWQRWNEEDTSMIGGGYDRLTSLETSVQLSILSPRMRRDPDALAVLSVVSLLPDGLSPEALHACTTQLSVIINVKRAVSTLRQNALIYEDPNHFLRVLSPISLFIRSHHPPDPDARTVVQNYFVKLASRGASYHDLDVQQSLRAESGNIEAILTDVLQSDKSANEMAEPVLNFCQFMYCYGFPSTQPIELLIHQLEAEILQDQKKTRQKTPKTPGRTTRFRLVQRWKSGTSQAKTKDHFEATNASLKLIGDCFGCWGQMLSRQSKFRLARYKFERAVRLHERAGDFDGRAYDLHNLGYLLIRDVSTLEQASARFQEAYEMHKRIGDRAGQAHDLMGRGHVFLQSSRFQDAQKQFQDALTIFVDISDEAGQAVALNNLGSTLSIRSNFKDAEEMYQKALSLSTRTGDLIGKAQSFSGLSSSFLLRSKFADARKHIKAALDARSPYVDPDHLHILGRVNIAEYCFANARTCLEEARKLHKEIGDTSGEADDYHYLAHLSFFQGEVPIALERAKTAKELYEEVGNTLGKADATAWEGITSAIVDWPENGVALLEEALALHVEVNCILGQAFDIHNIGWKYLRQYEPNVTMALEMFEKSLHLHEAAGNTQGEADNHNKIAECLVRFRRFPEAVLRISHALSLHMQICDLGGQADDIYVQGSIFLHQRQFDDAEKVLKLALDMHRQVGLKFGEARDLATLASVLFEQARSEFMLLENPQESDLAKFEPAITMINEAKSIFEGQIYAKVERHQCAVLQTSWKRSTSYVNGLYETPIFGWD